MEAKKLVFKAFLEEVSGNVWGAGLVLPYEVSSHFLQNKTRRVVCVINEKSSYSCGLMPLGNDKYFVNVNADLQKELHVKIGDEVSVVLKADESKYGLPMPEELQAILDMDEYGNEMFHQLTPGKQRNLLHIIGKPKSTEIRLKKAITIIEYLKEVAGKLDFKELNIAIKRSNNC